MRLIRVKNKIKRRGHYQIHGGVDFDFWFLETFLVFSENQILCFALRVSSAVCSDQ